MQGLLPSSSASRMTVLNNSVQCQLSVACHICQRGKLLLRPKTAVSGIPVTWCFRDSWRNILHPMHSRATGHRFQTLFSNYKQCSVTENLFHTSLQACVLTFHCKWLWVSGRKKYFLFVILSYICLKGIKWRLCYYIFTLMAQTL